MIDIIWQKIYDNFGLYSIVAFVIWFSIKQGISFVMSSCIAPVTARHIKFLDDVTKSMDEFNKTLHSIISEQQKLRYDVEKIDTKVGYLSAEIKEINRGSRKNID